MAVALVGFDVGWGDRVYGVTDVERDAIRRQRNATLKAGTHKLYSLFLELLQDLPPKETRKDALLLNVAKIWSVLLVPLVWRNSQTRTPLYEGLLPSSFRYWEGKLTGFEWPEHHRFETGIWAPLGSLAYYFFHYSVTSCPADPVNYAESCLVLYWRHLSEQFADPNLSYNFSPGQRWRSLKRHLGWRAQDYKLIEEVLFDWLNSGNPQMQLEMQRSFITTEHFRDLENKLILGTASPSLVTFLCAYQSVLEKELTKRTQRRHELSLEWPVSQRWKLGPGGVPQVVFACFLEGLISCIQLFSLYPGVSYCSFLAGAEYKEARKLALNSLCLMYDSLSILGEQYEDLLRFRSDLLYMIVEFLAGFGDVTGDGDWRLSDHQLNLNAILSHFPDLELSPDLSWMQSYPEVQASLVLLTPFDQLRVVDVPTVVASDELVIIRVEGRPGVAVDVKAEKDGADVFFYSKPVLIGDDGYACVPVLFWSLGATTQPVNLTVQVMDSPTATAPFRVMVKPLSTNSQSLLRGLQRVFLKENEVPWLAVLAYYRQVIPRMYQLEYGIIDKVLPLEQDELVPYDPVEEAARISVPKGVLSTDEDGTVTIPEWWISDNPLKSGELTALNLLSREQKDDPFRVPERWELELIESPATVEAWQPQPPSQQQQSSRGSRRRAGGGSNVIGLVLGNVLKLFQALGRTNPINSNEKQQAKLDQQSYFSGAQQSVQLAQQSSQVQQQAVAVQEPVEKVAPDTIKKEVKVVEETVIPDTGGAIAAATVSRADGIPAGRVLNQAHEVWQVSSQHARVQATANFEVTAPQTLIASQILNMQVRHRVGIHDHVQDTAQYLWYRAGNLRQMVAENNIDFNNKWYKATSANAHYVAGHHYQYGDELLVQVGRVKQDEEEKDLENKQDLAAGATADAEVEVPQTAEAVLEAAQGAEGVEGVQNLTNQAVEATQRSAQQLDHAMQVLTTLAGQTGLGTFNSAIGAVFGNAGALANALSTLATGAGQFGSAFNSAMEILGQIQSAVGVVSGIQAQIAQGLGGGGSTGEGGQGGASLDQQLQEALAELDALIQSSEPELIGNLTKVVQEAQRISAASGTSTAAIQKLITDITSGKYDSAVRVNEFAPYKVVIAGDGLAMVDMVSKALGPLAQAIGGDVAGKAVQIATSVASGIISSVQGFSGLGSVGDLASTFAGALNIPGVSQALSMVPGVGQAFQAAAAFGNIPGLEAASAVVDALGMRGMVPLHPENSQVGKYGNYIIDVYRDMTIGVKMGNYRVRALKDISLMTKLGRLRGHGLILSMHGRKQAEFGSEGQTILRGLDVRVDAEIDAVVKGEVVHIKGDVIYLDAGSIICGTLPVVGDMPALEAIAEAATLVQKAQQIMSTIQQYMEYLQMAMDALGLGSGGGAPHMQSPPPLQTTDPPVQVVPRTQPDAQSPAGGALPPTTQPPKEIPTGLISPVLVAQYARNPQAANQSQA